MADSQDLRSAIAVEAVEWAPGADDKLTISIRGRWRRRRGVLSGQPVLVIEAEGQRHRFPATPEPPSLGGAPPGGWQMTFTIPAWLAPHLSERAWLQLGLAVMPLPHAVGPPDRPVDSETLTERRARTAELAEERARARVSEAEAVVAELTIRIEELERALKQARDEPARLRKLIDERDQQRRAAEQRAHAEYAMRVDLEDALAAATDGDDRAQRIQAGELAAAEERARELEDEAEELRRQVAEAERFALAARSAPVVQAPVVAEPVGLSPRVDLGRELAIASSGGRIAPVVVPSSERGLTGAAELRALREERVLATRMASGALAATAGAAADEDAIMRLQDTVAILRAELGERAAAEAQAKARLALAEQAPLVPAQDAESGALAAVLAELRDELERLSTAAEREAHARLVGEERVRELELRIGELEQELRDRDARAQRAFETIGELRELLARLAGGALEPVTLGQVEAGPDQATVPEAEAEEVSDPKAAIELERFDAALARLRIEAGAPDDESDESDEPELQSASASAGGATRPWLREAFATLVMRDPATAGELLVGLLVAQGAVWQEPIAYDVVLGAEDVLQLTSAGGGVATTVEWASSLRELEQVAVRISGEPAAVGRLMVASPFRRRMLRRGLARVQGDRRALAAPAAILDARLDLGDLLAAGVRLEARLALALISAMVRPSWTVGERFTIAHEPTSPGAPTFINVASGDPVTVTAEPPLEPAATTITSGADELLAVLAGISTADVEISGDPAPLLALVGWLERAQRG